MGTPLKPTNPIYQSPPLKDVPPKPLKCPTKTLEGCATKKGKKVLVGHSIVHDLPSFHQNAFNSPKH